MRQRRVICLEITGKCGLNCLICSSDSNPHNNIFLERESIYDILDDGNDLGYNELALSGGDPFIHPDFFEIIKYAKRLGYYVTTYSNGNILEGSIINPLSTDLYSKLDKVELDKLVFSLHSTQRTIHDTITQVKGSYDNLITSLNLCRNGFNFEREVNFVIMNVNYRDLNEIVDFLRRFELKKLHLMRFVSHGRGKVNEELLDIQKYKLKRLLRDFYYKKDKLIDLIGSSSLTIIESETDDTCRALHQDKLCITPMGYVFPCVAMKNIHDNDSSNNIYQYSLKEILKNSDVFKNIRSTFRTLSNHKIVCYDCPAQIRLKNIATH